MVDFSLEAYRSYMLAMLRSYEIITFLDYLKGWRPESFVIIRHDVDRHPARALKMARLESDLGIRSTYYFRTKSVSLDYNVADQIYDLGHDIGYHYECLADTNGDHKKALSLFEKDVHLLKQRYRIETVSMHGRPLSRYDSRDMFSDSNFRSSYFNNLGIIGEIYLDVDYKDIAYITDTGRSWADEAANLRDSVEGSVKHGIRNAEGLMDSLNSHDFNKVIFQVHPERWCDNRKDWLVQWVKDKLVNVVKLFVNKIR